MSEELGDAASHFTTEALGERGGVGRYVNVDAMDPVEFLPGLGFRPVLGQRAMANFVSFEPGAEAPRHVHEEEQIVIVVDGEFTFDLDGDVRTMRRGDGGGAVLGPAWRLDDGQPLPGDRCVLPAAGEPAQAGGGAVGRGRGQRAGAGRAGAW